MEPYEFHKNLKYLGWSHAVLADIMECNISLVEKWAHGKVAIPKDLDNWLREIVDQKKATKISFSLGRTKYPC